MPATHVRQLVHPLLLLATCSLLGALIPAERAMAQTQRPVEDRSRAMGSMESGIRPRQTGVDGSSSNTTS
jgi:hypothetical protein